MSLFQIVYVSAAREPLLHEELDELLAKARRKNTELNVTGCLLYHDQQFLQILEGPREAVQGLMNTIAKDDRHTGVVVLMQGERDEREFGEWSMGFARPQTLAERPEGFLDIFQDESFQSDELGGRAHKLLLGFRDNMI